MGLSERIELVHVVLGSGGMARETFWILQEQYPERQVVFADAEAESGAVRVGDATVPIVRDWRFGELGAVTGFSVAVEDPLAKHAAVQRALEVGLTPAPALISRDALYRGDAQLGVGTVAHARCYVSTGVRVGDYVLLMPMAGLAHDVTVHDYATCGPISTNCGYCEIGEGAYIGQGSSVRERCKVAPWVRVEMQSSVVSDILEPGVRVSGVPARAATATG